MDKSLQNTKLSASLEDYLEVIFNLLEKSETARSKDIADTLGVAKPSVTGALKALSERGLVNYKPYGYVTLTELGRKSASNIAAKHNVIENFLIEVLGVEKESAKTAACKLEHNLGPKITAKLLSFTEFANKKIYNGHNLAEMFINYCNNDLQEDK